MNADDLDPEGLATRRRVMGDAYVDAALAAATPFTAEFQDLITRYAWGEVWSRPGLPLPTRRLVALSMLLALGREREFAIHVRAALDDGVAPEALKEVILQAAIYCGVPAALDGFTVAAEILSARGK